MIFVTKCPCDECVPLIKGAGIKQIYAGDVDAGKKKADISYMKFGELEGVTKFTVSVLTYYMLKIQGGRAAGAVICSQGGGVFPCAAESCASVIERLLWHASWEERGAICQMARPRAPVFWEVISFQITF